MPRALRSLLVVAIVACFASPIFAQAPTGTPPFGSFGGGPDVINLANLNAHISIPIVHKSGRGLNFTYDLGYDSSVWSPVSSSGAGVWTPDASWGWRALSAALTGSVPIRQTWGSCFFTDPNSGLRYKIQYPTTTYTGYKDSFGTLHTATIITTAGDPDCDSPVDPVYTGSTTAIDGSGYLLTVNEQANPSIVVTRPNGQLINNPGTSTATVIDPNGNKLTTSLAGSTTTFTDTLGTTVLTVAGSGTPTSPITYTYPAASGGNATLTVNYTAYTVQTIFGCGGVMNYGPTSNNLVSEIDLPDGSKYIFTYETTPSDAHNPHYVTGRILSVKLPTGGTISYTYTGGSTGHITCSDGSASGLQRFTPDTGSNFWNYARAAGTGAAYTTTITDPSAAANQTVIKFQSIFETQRLIYQGSTSGTLMQTVNTCYNGAASPCTATAVTLPITQRAAIFTLPGPGNLQAKHVDFFNSLGLTTESDDYDFGAGAPQTTALKKTLITYASLGANLNSYVQTVKIQDGTAATKYRQDFSYVQSTFTGPNCITGAPQHDDAGHGCSFLTRPNLTSVTNYTDPVTPAGAITKNFTYDSLGNLRTAQLNCCQLKTWNYSATTQYAFPDSIIRGSGSPSLTSSSTYNNNSGVVLSTTDPNNLTTNFTYDLMGRLASTQPVTSPTTPATLYTYADYDNSSSFTNWTAKVCTPVQASNTVCQKAIFDNQGRPITQQTLDGSSTLYSATDAQYDVFGRAYKTSNPYSTGSGSYWTTTQFDVLGRRTSSQLPAPDNSQTTYAYADATVTITDPAGKQSKTQSDALGRLVSVWEPDPANGNSLTLQTTNAYNVLDALTTVTQGLQTRTYSYDALGRVNKTTTPEAGVLCFGSMTGSTCNTDGYDAFNNLVKRTDARGVLTTYGYDTLNRPSSTTYTVTGTGVTATPSVNYTFGIDSSCNTAHGNGCIGRLITMTDGVGSENYTYNNLGEMTQLQKVVNGTTYTMGYAYNTVGELTQITYPSGRAVQQNVDAIGRLSSIVGTFNSVNTTYASNFAYNSAFQATSFQYGNNVFASFGFSSDRLQLNCLDYSTTNRGTICTHDGTTKFGLTYSYGSVGNNNGQITGITDSVDPGRSVNYGYDALYRITSAVTTGSANYVKWGLGWTYDRYGNRLLQSQTFDAPPTNSVTVSATTNRITGSPYAYDANGNMTNDGNNTLVYDAENRVLGATNGASSGTYTYDGKSFRVKKVSGSTTTIYIFSGPKVIAEYSGTSAPYPLAREYIYSRGALLAKIESGATKYYHSDSLSNRLVTDSSGTTVAQLGHYPFGESWYNASSDKLLFTSYERDSESGNDYAMVRSSVNRLARFSSPDPFPGFTGNPQSLNRYSYSLNDPADFADPSGMTPKIYQCNDSDPVVMPGCGSGNGGGGGGGCTLNLIVTPCGIVNSILSAGAAFKCADNNCEGITVKQDGTMYRYQSAIIWRTYWAFIIGEPHDGVVDGVNGMVQDNSYGFGLVALGASSDDNSSWFWTAMNAYWERVPWGVSFGIDSGTIANAGVSIPVAYIPKTNTVCVGLGPALSASPPGEDFTVNGGPFMLVDGNAKDVLGGISLSWGVQPTPIMGYQHSVNTSGQAAGPTGGSIDASIAVTVSGCWDIK